MSRTYRTAQGRQVDMERLRLQNELTPAVGNMRVNARGDQLGPGGKVVQTREEMLDQYYKNTVNRKSNVADEIPTSSDSAGRTKDIEADDFVDTPTRKPAPTADLVVEAPVAEAPVKKRAAKKKPKVTETPVVEEPVKKSQLVPPSLKEADAIAETAGTDDSEIDLGKADKNSGLNSGEAHIKGGLAKAIAKTREYEQNMGRGKPKRI